MNPHAPLKLQAEQSPLILGKYLSNRMMRHCRYEVHLVASTDEFSAHRREPYLCRADLGRKILA
jgi:hypothetical protein